MIRYKKVLGTINIITFIVVFSYCFRQIQITPLTFLVSIAASLTSLILINLLYFDLEQPVASWISNIKLRDSAAERSLND